VVRLPNQSTCWPDLHPGSESANQNTDFHSHIYAYSQHYADPNNHRFSYGDRNPLLYTYPHGHIHCDCLPHSDGILYPYCNADSYSNSHRNTDGIYDSLTDRHPLGNVHADVHGDTDLNRDGYRHEDGNTGFYARTDRDFNPFTDSHTDLHLYGYAHRNTNRHADQHQYPNGHRDGYADSFFHKYSDYYGYEFVDSQPDTDVHAHGFPRPIIIPDSRTASLLSWHSQWYPALR